MVLFHLFAAMEKGSTRSQCNNAVDNTHTRCQGPGREVLELCKAKCREQAWRNEVVAHPGFDLSFH